MPAPTSKADELFENFWVGHMYGTACIEWSRLAAQFHWSKKDFSKANQKRLKKLFQLLEAGY